LAYWQQKLADVAPLQLPTDHIRPAVQSTRGAITAFSIDKALAAQLHALSEQQGTTLFMTLLAAFNVLLHRYSGQEDICIGTPVAGRWQRETEELIGFFVNTVVLRTSMSSDISFTQLLRQVRTNALEAFEHQDAPFEKIVEAVVKERDLSRNPLFQVMFVFQNRERLPELELGHLALDEQNVEDSTSLFDLSMSIVETSQGLRLGIEYSTDLFEQRTIVKFGEHFTSLLQAIVHEPNQAIGSINMLSEAEQHQLLHGFNDTAVPYADKTLVDLFEEQVQRTPLAVVVKFRDSQLTYKELDERTNQLAHYLRKREVKQESLVAICLDRSLEMIIGILGILKAGGAYVPIDPEYPQERIGYMLHDTGATVVLSSAACADRIAVKGTDIIELDTHWLLISNEPVTRPAIELMPSHLAYVIYTSGSTGRPKGVMNEHRGVVNRLCWTQDHFRLGSEDVVLQKTTFCFDVSVWELLWPLMAGAKLVFAEPGGHKDNTYLKAVIEQEGITVLHFVPSMLGVFLPDLAPGACGSLRKVLCSGEALNAWQANLFREKLPSASLHNLYGPTEAAVDVTCWDVPAGNIDKVVIGKPIANTSIYILNSSDQLVPAGGIGEICIGGVQVARGYLNQAALTEEKFISDPFSNKPGARLYRTGDLGRWLSDGNIEYLGRIDDQVKIRGYRIELGEVEAALLQTRLVQQAVVIAKEASGSNRLIGYVVPEGEFRKEAILEHLRNTLPDYMIPSVLMQIEHIPLTPNGKADKRSLPDPDVTALLKDRYAAPRNEAEQALVSIWQELLNIERIGIHDNFFELGGDSIITIQVTSRARRLGYELHPRDLFMQQTIAGLSAIISDRLVSGTLPVGEQGVLTGESGLLPIQQWFFEQEQPSYDHYNQSFLFSIDKSIQAGMLRQASMALLEQHDALRFSYRHTAEGWKQSYGTVSTEHVVIEHTLEGSTEEELVRSLESIGNTCQQSLSLQEGKLIKLVLLHTPASEPANRLLVIIHHLAVDGVSWRILLEDLEHLLNNIKNNKALSLPGKTSSYRQWYHALEAYSRSRRVTSQLSYWEEVISAPGHLPLDKGYDEPVRSKDIRATTGILSAALTRSLLQEVPKAYRTEINDVLLTALARTLGEWSGNQEVLVGLEGHGREQVSSDTDTSRTVGWFTSLYPVRLQSGSNQEYGGQLREVKESLRRITDKGIGYGVLKYISKELQQPHGWEIVFNYLGQFDNAVKEGGLLQGAAGPTGHSISEEHIISDKLVFTSYIT
ncbi:MAG TPA: amino acid adenylation domain-containing protein, partial [Chitinophagaceae bacterium]|nr:amino acid adenylation domain-containing protein [Chitinophagaceae bacterium]